MAGLLTDELAASWPPTDDGPDAGYQRSPLASTSLLAVCGLASAGKATVRAVAVAAEPSGRLHLVPVVSGSAGWRRAHAGDGVAAALVAAIDGEATDGEATDREGFSLRRLGQPGAATRERAIGVDQTNESVVVGESVVVKWLLHPEPGEHRAPAILAHLVEVGYQGMPRPYGSLDWTSPDGRQVVLALVDAYLPDARDGWEWCVDLLVDHLGHAGGGCPPSCDPGFPARLGILTAGLHAALATPSTSRARPTRPAGRDELGAWQRAAETIVTDAVDLTDGHEGHELRAMAPRIRSTLASLGELTGTLVQPIHGDLHVGQVLRWREGLAVIDFDGNPAIDGAVATGPQPAARDVAQLCSSVDHVGRVADRRTGGRHASAIDRWVAGARVELLAAYRAELAGAGHPELFDERLLPAFEVEQECRELLYAARFLPRWRYAPMASLRAWFAQ